MEIKNLKDLKNYIIDYNGLIEVKTLSPMHDSRKSFYGKAEVKKLYTMATDISLLYSYNTLVCGIVYNNNNDKIKYIINTDIQEKLLFSHTTLRHLKEFLIQNIDVLRLSHLIDGKITKADIIKNNNKILN